MRIIIFLPFLFISICYGQIKVDTLKNNSIIQLKSVGFSEDLIKSKIQNTFCQFDLNTDALIQLKKAGISDIIITSMINKSNNSNLNTDNKSLVTSKDVSSITPGIYYCKGSPCELLELEASVFSQTKSESGILTSLTYGLAKTKARSSLNGISSNFNIEDNKPSFYFYFNTSNSSNFGENSNSLMWFNNATSPNEFILVKFNVTKKSRDVITGSWNTYEGMSSGIDESNKIPFRYEKTAKGVYKVYTEKPLINGQYCFMYAGSASGSGYGSTPLQKAYDFGIK